MLRVERWCILGQYTDIRLWAPAINKVLTYYYIWPLAWHGPYSMVMDPAVFISHIWHSMGAAAVPAQQDS